MKDIIQQLQDETRRRRPMSAKTLRLPEKVLSEIKEFTQTHKGISESVVLRRCLVDGWERMKQSIEHE